MNNELTNNPVKALTPLDRIRNYYWNNRTDCDSVMFIGAVASVVVALVVLA